MGKAIVMFADGTGNARTARFRTNVWKMYSALELSSHANQIAYYIDGVGTSSFAPLKLLGGIFGVGVKRNVRELYGFLCRNYEKDDQIYIFGFSRGAFTARVLASLVARVGVLPLDDDRARAGWVREAFREYRRQVEYKSRAKLAALVDPILTAIADGIRAAWRRWVPPRWLGAGSPLQPGVAMVGCWDTVSAYGGPITEMVRAWDQYITPLSLPDYKLHPAVERARHALALDEEREAFLPLLWDECAEDPNRPEPRIKQMWFAGVHSDVGGGYADRGLSAIPLAWMIDEAKAAGLAFDETAVAKINRVADPTAPIHDSRGGIGAFYRYQPRRLSVLTGNRPSPLRDPVSGDGPLIDSVEVHPSVLSRVLKGCDGYAPIVLPDRFDVAGHTWQFNIDGQIAVWRQVARRRRLQFLLLVIVLLMLLSPAFPGIPIVDYVNGAWTPVVTGVLGFVPGMPAWAASAYGGSGVWLAGAAIGIAFVLYRTERRRLAIAAAARRSWRFDADAKPAPPSPKLVRRLDRRGAVRRWWKWTALPAVFGALYYSVVLVALFVGANKAADVVREHDWTLCPPSFDQGSKYVFDTAQPCQALQLAKPLEQGVRYRLMLVVPETERWHDGGVATDPTGFSAVGSVKQGLAEKEDWPKPWISAIRRFAVHGMGVPTRRILTARWFQPVIAVRPDGGRGGMFDPARFVRNVAVPMTRTDGGSVFYGEFVAPANGQAYLFVNDATVPFVDKAFFYTHEDGRNRGRACYAIHAAGSAFVVDEKAATDTCVQDLKLLDGARPAKR